MKYLYIDTVPMFETGHLVFLHLKVFILHARSNIFGLFSYDIICYTGFFSLKKANNSSSSAGCLLPGSCLGKIWHLAQMGHFF